MEEVIEKENQTILDFGIASKNEDKLRKFLDKLHSISIDNPKKWEAGKKNE